MKTIHHVLDPAVPAAKVYEALTTEEGLAGWWTTDVSAPDAAVGAAIDFRFELADSERFEGATRLRF
jgi:uncharacterized protein YndB with AHSA1/START domain